MFKFFYLISLLCLSSSFLFSQTFYISSSKGKDSNSGLDSNSAFQNISKLNTINFGPGSKILFRKGDKWVGQQLIINSSGSSENDQNRIILSSYGNGNKPILDLRSDIPGWRTSSNWTKISGDTIWTINYSASSRSLLRLWLDDSEYVRAINLTGDNADGTFGVNRVHRFYKSNSENKLYVYVPAGNNNPANYYNSIEYPGTPDNTLYLKDADYITINDLDIRGGMYSAIGLGGSDYVKIMNCNIGQNSNWAGVVGQFGNSSDNVCSNIEIENNLIDCHRRITQKLYDGVAGVEYGISASSGAEGWLIHNNTIVDWSFGVVTLATPSGFSKNHSIYDNEIYHTKYNLGWGKGIQINGQLSYENGYTYDKVYNNYFHDLSTTGVSVCGNGNYVYYNIIARITESVSTHAGQGNSGFGIQLVDGLTGVGSVKDNYIFNNTFYQTNNRGVQDNGTRNFYYNNIFANCNMAYINPITIQLKSNGSYAIEFNLFFREDKTSDDKFVQVGSEYFTVDNFNSYLLLSGDQINKQYFGILNQLLNPNDFSLVDQNVIKDGFNISSLLPDGFKDRNGNLVNRTQPSVGAISSINQNPTGMKVLLEGPYINGEMINELNIDKLIPLKQPYNVSPWNYSGNETVSSLPNDIVDWVLVELRSSVLPASTVARKAAFLRTDGSITDLDGISPLKFSSSLTGSYYVVIKHRNHLAIMSSQPVQLVNSTIQYDFTTSESKAYGQNSMTDLGNGVYGMYGGDVDANGSIDDKDVIDVSQKLFSNGYIDEDCDMNSPVNVLDYKLPNINKSKSTNVQ